jgi:hypothetical protein
MSDIRSPRITPYNTGKVKIGSSYTPPTRRYITAEEERVQNLLLNGHIFDPWDRVIMGIAAVVAVVSAVVLMMGR